MDLGLYYDYCIVIMILTICFSLLIDTIMGDPHFKYHPVNMIGNTINWLKHKLRTSKAKLDKFMGVLLLILVIIMFCIPLVLLQIFLWWIWNSWDITKWNVINFLDLLILTAIMGLILKWTYAIKNLGDSTLPISTSLKCGDLEKAKSALSLIVRRDTEKLEEPHIISATVECIAESSTDAITSVFWFYLMGNLIGIIIFTYLNHNILWLFLGIPFAYIFRIINTADSIVGYKDQENINIGWFSARMDDFSNYLPTRLTVLFMLLAGKILKKDVRTAWNVLKSDKNITESVNAGWTISTMAGLLNVRLEKIGYYKLGVPNRALEPNDIKSAIRIIQVAVILFIFIISFIIILIIIIIIL